ncbi:aminopeptidase N [Allocatelliglobosispora scoriae]|uniref:Aminopeptidase N n=1 Tax=Allocatelliglobosispora scoriae TaxID=643052 RepID=A0A841BSS7_9ACTN|nr:aminopeptidase N [Allocatelliglobosispora scoriae]MBB5869792.1 aminopeptidase N [Allocatelliglobosispora scoriae]
MPSLTHAEAITRAELIHDLDYELDFDLTGSRTFRATTVLRFRAATPGAETFVELLPTRVISATLNGELLEGFDDGRLVLRDLAETNEVVVVAEYDYSNTGEGLHRFVDPADGNVYVYAQPSIAEAPRFMACFDQPDLKAPVTLRVTCDPKWIVRANGEGTATAPGRWEFEQTKPLATYLITLIAGPYHEVRTEHDGIPMGLFARAAFAAHLENDAEEIFEITRACLDRYHELFGVRMPFGKYDQAFVPEFSWGAMEFPGLVVFRDELIFHAAVTDTERLDRAAIIAHEMAHMWFGDLVTMRWWDDLWLNESFATYMGYRMVAEVTAWPQSWTRFGVNRKTFGYAADQRPSTHPIAPKLVTDVDAAFANFDSISYAKGCSSLRQLVAWLGDEAFFTGLKAHFEKHAWGNATLDDLLESLSASSGRDLSEWARVWLRTPQVNTLTPVVTWDDAGRFASVAVRQTASAEFPTLRPHRIGIGWFDETGVWQRTEVDIDPAADGGLTPVPQLTGVFGRGLLLNDGDLTFAKIRLDERSRADLPSLLVDQPDSLARALMWNSAFDAVRDGEWPGDEMIRAAAVALPHETEVAVFESVFQLLRSHVATQFVAADRQDAAVRQLGEACRAAMTVAEPGSSRQLAAARSFISCLDSISEARAWLAGVGLPDGLVVDSELRWSLLLRLGVLGDVSDAELDAALAADQSARGVESATKIRAARPDAAAKAAAFEIIVSDRTLSNRQLAATAAGFWRPEHAELTDPYVGRFFAEIGATAQWRAGQLLNLIGEAAYPTYAVAPSTVEAADRMIAAGGLHPMLERVIVDETDDMRRAVVAQARWA